MTQPPPETMPVFVLEMLSDTGRADYRGAVEAVCVTPPVRQGFNATFYVPCACVRLRKPPSYHIGLATTPTEVAVRNVRLEAQSWRTPKRDFRVWTGLCERCRTLFYAWEAEEIDKFTLDVQKWEQERQEQDRVLANQTRGLFQTLVGELRRWTNVRRWLLSLTGYCTGNRCMTYGMYR